MTVEYSGLAPTTSTSSLKKVKKGLKKLFVADNRMEWQKAHQWENRMHAEFYGQTSRNVM